MKVTLIKTPYVVIGILMVANYVLFTLILKYLDDITLLFGN